MQDPALNRRLGIPDETVVQHRGAYFPPSTNYRPSSAEDLRRFASPSPQMNLNSSSAGIILCVFLAGGLTAAAFGASLGLKYLNLRPGARNEFVKLATTSMAIAVFIASLGVALYLNK